MTISTLDLQTSLPTFLDTLTYCFFPDPFQLQLLSSSSTMAQAVQHGHPCIAIDNYHSLDDPSFRVAEGDLGEVYAQDSSSESLCCQS